MLLVLSPKSHSHSVITSEPPVERSVKFTFKGAGPEVGEALKFAWGNSSTSMKSSSVVIGLWPTSVVTESDTV